MRHPTLVISMVGLMVLLTGCATSGVDTTASAKNRKASHPAPADLVAKNRPIAVVVKENQPLPDEVPTGAHAIPNSQVVVSDSPEIDTEALKKAETKEILQIYVDDHVKYALGQALKSQPNAERWRIDPSETHTPKLELTPVVHFVPDEFERSSLYLTVRARLTNESGKEIWSSRYSYLYPESRKIIGPGGWTDQGGEKFKRALSEGFRSVSRVILRDTGQHAAWTITPATVKSKFLGQTGRTELKGEILQENDEEIIFRAKGPGLSRGINILPKFEVEVRR